MATTTTVTTFTRLDDAPTLRAAEAKRRPVLEKLRDAKARFTRIAAVLNPIDSARSTRPERLRGAVAAADLESEIALLEADDADCVRTIEAARDQAFEAMRVQFDAADLADCEELIKILGRAQEVEARRLARIEMFTTAANGRAPSCDVGTVWFLHPGMWVDQWAAWVTARR